MSGLDEIRERMDALEAEVSRLREDAAATRTLAAMADRDASEVRVALHAHTQSLNALRETQLEQGRTLDAHTNTLHALAEVVGGLVTGQQELAETVSGLTQTVSGLTQTVGGLVTGQQELAETVGGLADGQQRHDQSLAEIASMVRGLTERG